MFRKHVSRLIWVVLLSLCTALGAQAQLQAAEDLDSFLTHFAAANLSDGGSISLEADITLTLELPPITGSVTIEGNGHTISGDSRFRIFVVDGGTLTIRNTTLADGYSPEDGGAIWLGNSGELVLEGATFSGNLSDKGGGAISTSPSAVALSISDSVFEGNRSGSGGGAILVYGGSAEISSSVFQGNAAERFGGGLEAFVGSVDISNSTFVDNQAGSAGGILVSGATTTLTHLTLVDNRALWGEGDGIHKRSGWASLRNSIVAGGGSGQECTGGLDESSGNISRDGTCALLPSGDPMLGELTGAPGYLPLLDGSPALDAADAEFCLETDQIGTARPQGGGCDAGAYESQTATAPEATPEPSGCTLANHILSANTNTSVGGCPAGASHDIITLTEDITLSAPLPAITGTITIEGNGHTISGDNQYRIFTVSSRRLTLNDLTLTGGKAEGTGGAVLLQGGAELVVNNSTFSENTLDSVDIGGNRFTGGFGSAIGTERFSGSISVRDSEFRGNEAEFGGGAIYLNGGTANISGSAFISNRGPLHGGAIVVDKGWMNIENSTFRRNRSSNGGAISISRGSLTMTHLTMVANSSSYGGGAAIRQWDGSAVLRNSIVAGSSDVADCHGNVSGSGNFSEDGTCGATEAGDPQLDEMTGAPGFFPPLEGSPVVDAADAAYCLATDQTGKPRPQGAGCDIGAIEFGEAAPAEPTPETSECTLANHILSANTNTSVGGCPAGTSHDIITLTENIRLSAPLPAITGTITIEGNGHTISGDRTHRIFTVSSRKLTINDLTLTRGKAEGNGGAILVQGGAELVVNNSQFLRNVAVDYERARNRYGGGGGAIGTENFSGRISINNSAFDTNDAHIRGGALNITGGTTDISGTTFTINQGRGFGGAINVEGGRVNIQNSSFSRNRSQHGGGIAVNGGTVTLTHLTMFANRSTFSEGASIWQRRGSVSLRNSIVSGSSTHPDCDGNVSLRSNFSEDGTCGATKAGDPQLDEMSDMPGYLPPLENSPVVDAADAAYCLETDQTGKPRPQGAGCDIGAIEVGFVAPAEATPEPTECTLADYILSANSNTSVGGCPAGTSDGIITLTQDITLSEPLPEITGTITIEGNGHTISGDDRFRIFQVAGGKLTINNLRLTQAYVEGVGGAIFLRNDAELVVNDSTFEGNRVDYLQDGDSLFIGYGGAIGTTWFSGRLSVNNSEFTNNHAHSGGAIGLNGGSAEIRGSAFVDNEADGAGGAIDISGVPGSQVSIQNSTFSGNVSGNGAIAIRGATVTMTHLTMLNNTPSLADGSAIHVFSGATAQLRNSIVASGGNRLDCHGDVDVSRGNFSRDGSCALWTGGDPKLGELRGAPSYFPLMNGSPALDAADAEFCLETDQIGTTRPHGGGCDIGAFESTTATAPEPTPVPSACTLANHIISANTNTSVGGCPAGTSHDIITLTEDITLSAPLPEITGTITIEGNGHTISGGRTHRIFTVSSHKLTINDLTLTMGKAEGYGGAILVQGGAELVINNSQFLRNVAGYYEDARNRHGGRGGAIGTQGFSGRISISKSVFDTNRAEIGAGALYLDGGTTDISGSTFTSNDGKGFGGAIEVEGGRVNTQNSTFSLNRAANGRVVSVNRGTVTLTHLTIFGYASYDGGGAIYQRRGTVSLRNSIVAGGGDKPDCRGNVNVSGNFSQDGACGAAEAGDPQLDAMTGTPGYLPPLEGSPVVDAADAAYCLATDQTGKPRPQGAGCDIGAIEVGDAGPVAEEPAAEEPVAEEPVAEEAAGLACSVTTTDVLNFRDGPNGNWIGIVPANASFTALGFDSGWYNVEQGGVAGWISGDYVTTSGNCT